MASWRLNPRSSIRRRLAIYLSAGLILALLLTAGGSLAIALHELNEVADSQMGALARTLMRVTGKTSARHEVPDIEALLPGDAGDASDHDNGFAVWDEQGALIMADRHGREIPLQREPGFRNSLPLWQGGGWRYLYLVDAEQGHIVAVSQRWAERMETTTQTLGLQLLVSALTVPVLLVLLGFGIRRSLKPLDRLRAELAVRDARSLRPVSEQVPAEILPLVQSLNGLLVRTAEAMAREQRFTSDAAHELRSPLAALKVQAEVLAMTDEPEEQLYHIARLQDGIGRASHLVEQLLVFARLDPMQEIPDAAPIDWKGLAEQTLKGLNLAAREKRIRLRLTCPCGFERVLPMAGNALLLHLALRNLLDNAIRYSPEGSTVSLMMDVGEIRVCDEGAGIPAEHMARICERFYRPAGQSQQGSGLGLSIVESIARLHGLALVLENRAEQPPPAEMSGSSGTGLCARLVPAAAASTLSDGPRGAGR